MTDRTPTQAGLPFLRTVGYAQEQLAKIDFKVTLPQADGNTGIGAGALASRCEIGGSIAEDTRGSRLRVD